MKMPARRLALVAALFLAVTSRFANAYPDGIFDHARGDDAKPENRGCTCHGGLLDNTTTQLVIDGLPDGQLNHSSGYVAGQTYPITVWVVGAPIPAGVTGLNLRGFNLEASSGALATVDDSAQAENVTECQFREGAGACDPATTCGVVGSDPCRSYYDCYVRACTTPGVGDCRICSNDVVSIQATHTNSGGPLANTPAAELSDGNNVLFWQLNWTAPASGSGDVKFWLAGNVVNGNQANDVGDVWSVWPTPMVIHEQP